MPFTAPAQTVKHAVINRRTWYRLTRELVYEFELNGDTHHIVVPVDFITDKGTTPRWLWPWFPPDDEGTEAYILHDYLYSLGGVARFLADALLRDALAGDGVSWFRRVLIFWAVRFCGSSHKERPQHSTKRGFS